MSATSDEEKTSPPCYRSGAAARVARMPVTTLRIWERRYGVVSPPKSASGQRLYSSQDVQRLVLLKKLVERGHAIGSIARLELDQLDRLALTYTEVDARDCRHGAGAALAWRSARLAIREPATADGV
jgi:DNA-binding transcriptional MerR regulator